MPARVLQGILAGIRRAWLPLCLCFATAAQASVSVLDDAGRSISLHAPARRIVSLAPHATEILFAAGAGARVVGVAEYSDFPPEAKRIASVGSGVAPDLERILQLKPDLIVGWNNGGAATQLDQLAALGVPVFKSDPHDYATIASSIERLAHLAGSDKDGALAAAAFHQRLQALRASYAQRPAVRVFYQISSAPLMTLNGTHMVSAALKLCGGDNIFAALSQVAPTISVEAVLQANPEAIIAGNGAHDDPFARWRRFPQLQAVARNNLLGISGDLMHRAGPRMLEGTEQLCRQLDAVRAKR